jgi:septum site-determining protein MinD
MPAFIIEREAIACMVEVFAVASGKGGTGKTTSTMALGMALASEYDVTVIDADTGMANMLFHAGLADADTTLHDVLADEAPVREAVYERFGMSVVPCGTSLSGFQEAEPDRLRTVVATLATETDVILLDSPAALGSRSAVLPIVLADSVVVVLQPTIPSLSDGMKVQEYATTYGTDVAGVLFNRVTDDEAIDRIARKAGRYFEGETLATVPESEVVREARRASEPLLAHAPESTPAAAYREAAATLTVSDRPVEPVADRFRSAVIPDHS